VILKGSFIFAADLVRHIQIDIPVAVEFIAASSYGNAIVSSGRLEINDLGASLEGKDVLIVEDIVDTGLTLAAICERVRSVGARSMRIAALLDKELPGRNLTVKVDYVGFKIPNVFVVGYGLDYAQHYRNLKEIRVLDAQ